MEKDELNLTALAKHFSSEDAAREFLEKLRWPDGPVCPRCGALDKIYKLQGKSATWQSSIFGTTLARTKTVTAL